MNRTFKVPCSNCGGVATRSYFTSQAAKYQNCPKNQVIQVECDHCDYLMVMCSVSGSVVEAYDSATSIFTSGTSVFTKQDKNAARITLSA